MTSHTSSEGARIMTAPRNLIAPQEQLCLDKDRCRKCEQKPGALISWTRLSLIWATLREYVLALDLEGVHDVKLHHPSSSVATSNQ